MPNPPRQRLSSHFRRSDLRGFSRLATQATSGVARIAEGVHQSVLGTLGMRGRGADRAGGLTGFVYRSVDGVSRGVGRGIEAALNKIEPMLGDAVAAADEPISIRREAVLSTLNGVMGDRLEADNSPFAIKMSFRHQGRPLDLDQPLQIDVAGSKLVLLIHGLCMNDRQWQAEQHAPGHNLGRIVARELGHTDLYLHYNSGRHISHNGRDLARQLELLLQQWPVQLDELVVIAHSMGGLVMRAAIELAGQEGMAWPAVLKSVVFLGTPHHGAPLERAGNGVDLILASSRWTAPFSSLAALRSPGITDLRYGNLLDEDWESRDRFVRQADTRRPLPLPSGITFHTIAASTAARRGLLADRLIGDGLVPLNSALGVHKRPERTLDFKPGSRWICYRTGHLELLSRPEVSQQILHWLMPIEPVNCRRQSAG